MTLSLVLLLALLGTAGIFGFFALEEAGITKQAPGPSPLRPKTKISACQQLTITDSNGRPIAGAGMGPAGTVEEEKVCTARLNERTAAADTKRRQAEVKDNAPKQKFQSINSHARAQS